MVKWSILICTIGQRDAKFRSLLNRIVPQTNKYKGSIEVIAYWNNGELPLSEIRQKLVDSANGEYISFVDDDDRVPEYYCKEVMNALKHKPDYVGWQQQLWNNGEKMKPTFHSIRYKEWSEDEDGWYRDISHLNPIKKSIAKKVSFVVERGTAEDTPWAAKIRPFVKNEVYINRVMYHYLHTQTDSTWRGNIDNKNFTRPKDITFKHFRFV